MPLFMDLHVSPTGDIPIDELIQKHKADLAAQHKYGVEFKSLWVNKEKGMVFCLMKGPDKKACINVHQNAHGDTGCNIIEVNPGDYNKYLASSWPNANDIAETQDGMIDTAYRTVLRLEIMHPLARKNADTKALGNLIRENQGSLILDPHHSLRAVFVHPSAAFGSALEIRDLIHGKYPDYRLSIVSGKPVEQHHDKFYGYVTELSRKMSVALKSPKIHTTQLSIDLLKKENNNADHLLKNVNILFSRDEEFLGRLMNIIQENFSNPGFNATSLATEVFLSRSQLFKKTKKITGFTPNILIRELRLYEAQKLLSQDNEQIAQIAFDTGFNSPSYFSKVFAARFGLLPSEIIDSLKI